MGTIFLQNIIEEFGDVKDELIKIEQLNDKPLQRFKRLIKDSNVFKDSNPFTLDPQFSNNPSTFFDMFRILPDFIKDVFAFEERNDLSSRAISIVNKDIDIKQLVDICIKFNNDTFSQIEIFNSHLNCTPILYEIDLEKLCNYQKEGELSCSRIARSNNRTWDFDQAIRNLTNLQIPSINVSKISNQTQTTINTTDHNLKTNLSSVSTLNKTDTDLHLNETIKLKLNKTNYTSVELNSIKKDIVEIRLNQTMRLNQTQDKHRNNNGNLTNLKAINHYNNSNLLKYNNGIHHPTDKIFHIPLFIEYNTSFSNNHSTYNDSFNSKNADALKKKFNNKAKYDLSYFNKNTFWSFIWGMYGAAVFMLLYKITKIIYVMLKKLRKNHEKISKNKQEMQKHMVDVTHLVEYLHDSDDELTCKN